ncbi:MAG: tyrosine-type recombinase/integrase [Gammaproteobacteria bacterium]|nr:tyrosine-type recombinase/integrase [Gammaproteobacteria bacterium]MYF58646.1 tyrosine-type recombinase/integrase [Gammaproteobacteria bacterium]
MTCLAPHLETFLRVHLPRDLRASVHTSASYAQSFLQFTRFAAARLSTEPSQIAIEQLSVQVVLDFLDSLEKERENSIRTRNLRLVALKSFFRYLEYRDASCLELSRQVRAIPSKRFEQRLIEYLDQDEMQALLDAPDTSTTNGVRDRAMLHLTYAAGLRVSELLGINRADLGQNLETVHVLGKGRRERVLPLWKETRSVLEDWLSIRPSSNVDRVFLNARGRPMSRHGFAHRLKLHVSVAKRKMPSMARKTVTPHVLRHSCAMNTYKATNGDVRKVSIMLGHLGLKSTEVYVRTDVLERLEVLEARTAPQIRRGRYDHAQDRLTAMLKEVARV